ncbi:MAG: HAD family phosphatase [Deltaproteobacteria bacterium]|jgi:HAD superfamily hydrolase (TIGR01509 family)|nr:HAD family phosphatase [Deltaproteobacteria bacterium]MBW2477351.1 HAD family phosphatase [Deltaproteobacteria bacterium]MBW2504839.1 HAD family phosphatase [Deltaproteobacteria bacterium]
MNFKYIFWDNDGVLVDTEHLYYQANREAMAKVNFNLTHRTFVDMSLTQGRKILDLVEDMKLSSNQKIALRDWRNKRYMELLCDGELVLPEVRKVLCHLHGNFGMAVVTTSRRDHFDAIHRNSGLLQFFDFVLTREDYLHAKPNPEPYLLALANSKVPKDKCLVIEDSPRGLTAAKAAGLACWIVPSKDTSGQSFAGADRILGSVSELLSFLM